ncbi:MAG: hypothetical protein M3277_05440 [Actinomycetota bacterium]|nr:hypothetical protein [Actinomycetota bacterium]
MPTALAVFAAAAGAILLVGPRMARTADGLANATGMGGAFFGVVFLSLATDLPEVALTPTAVLSGSPRIAIGGLLGSATAQLVLIAVMDITFRRRRLYGRVRLLSSLGQCALMLSVLAVPLVVAAGDPAVGGIGAGAVLLLVVYLGALMAIRRIGREPQPASDPDVDTEAENVSDSLAALWLRFGAFALVLTATGIALEKTTETIGSGIGIGQTAAGALLAGVATSLPELVTALSAARAGAVELAVGDIVGSSALDVALLSLADVFYTDGSVFDLLGDPEFTLIGVSLALTSLLVVGLIRREVAGLRRAGVESYLMLVVYAIGAAILIAASVTGG